MDISNRIKIAITAVGLVAILGIEEYRIYMMNKPVYDLHKTQKKLQLENANLESIYGKGLRESFDAMSLSQLKFGYVIGISGGNLVVEDGKVIENPIPMCPELRKAIKNNTAFDYMKKFKELEVYSPRYYENTIKPNKIND